MKARCNWLGSYSLAVLLVLTSGCRAAHEQQDTAPVPSVTKDTVRLAPGAKPGPVQFKVAQATLQAALPLPAVTGRVTPVLSMTSPTFAPLAGRVSSVVARLGAKVTAGEHLIEVRAGELSTLKRDMETAQLTVKTREALVQRLEQLVAARIAPEGDLLVARSELAEARVALRSASERIQALSLEPSGQTTYWLKATRAGTVVALNATPGQHVAPEDSAPLVVIADLSQVVVEADVLPRDASEIHVGQHAAILAESTTPNIEGRVESVAEVVDPARQVVPVRIGVDNEQHLLRPNAFVRVVFSPAEPDEKMLVVPSAAVVSDGAHSVVFVETEPGVFVRRPVELGRRTHDLVEVTSGLSPIERVVTSGALLLLNALSTAD